MSQEFVILTVRGGVRASARGTGVGVRGRVREEPPSAEVARAELDQKGLHDCVRDPHIAGLAPVMPTSLIRPTSRAPDASTDTAWGVMAVEATRSQRSGADVTVAVLDTGVDAAHEAFRGVDLIAKDFIGSGAQDADGHGTHCAATILGRDVDGRRIGVAPDVPRLLSAKVLGDGGDGTTATLANGFMWALRQHAQVISMSLGLDFPGLVAHLVATGTPADVATSKALDAYRQNLRLFDALFDYNKACVPFGTGAVLVAAAGNESRRDVNADWDISVSLPAAGEGVVSVGAAGRSPDGLVVGGFSNSRCRVVAPGVDIPSARAGGGLITMTGTSMAAPHAAGVAALWMEELRSAASDATPGLVVERLIGSARTAVLGPEAGASLRGVGLVTAP
jgi:subtilisin family serine protease